MADRLTAILHIGTRKTGTSAVQAYLEANAGVLREQGTLVPATDDLRPNGFEIAYAASQGRGMDLYRRMPWFAGHDETVRRGEKAVTKGTERARTEGLPRIVFSAEDLSILDRPAIDRLMGLLTGRVDEVRVLCALRSQERYLASNVSTELRNGASEDPDTLFNRFADGEHYRLDYASMLDDWESAVKAAGCGEAAVETWVYEEGGDPADIVRTVLARAGIPHPSSVEVPPAPANTAIQAGGLMALRRFNAWSNARPAPANDAERASSNWLANQLQSAGADHKWGPSAERVDAVRARFARSNDAVRLRYFPDRPEPLFPAVAYADQPAPARETSVDDVLDALVPALTRLLKERHRARLVHRVDRARIAALEGRTEKAIREFQAVIESDAASMPSALFHLTRALEDAGRFTEAQRQAERFVQLSGGERGKGLLARIERRLLQQEAKKGP